MNPETNGRELHRQLGHSMVLALGVLMLTHARALGAGVAIAAAGITLAPTPASAFVCEEVTGGGDGASASPGGTACGTNAQAPGLFATAVGVSAGAWGSFSTALGVLSDAGGNSTDLGSLGNFNATAIGSNASAGTTAAGQDNATALGADSSANALNATALGAGATANFANSTAIGQGAATTRANQIALGTATNTYTMAGIGSADSLAAQDPASIRFVTSDSSGNLALSAFNPSSLASAASVAALDSRMGSLESRVGENQEEARGGTALALAAAGLRYDDRPEKLSIAGGVGHFKGLTGLSFGVGYATSDTFRINAAVSGVPELGDVGVSAGVSWTLN